MPDSLDSLDAFVLARGHAMRGKRVTFSWGGTDYAGTCGARDTMTELVEGGVINDQEFRILVATAEFGEATPPGERDTVDVCVDANGIPCGVDDAVGSRVTARIVSIGRAGGGLTYTVRTEQRG